MGLARQFVHMDQGDSRRRVPCRRYPDVVWLHNRKSQPIIYLGCSGFVRRTARNYGRAFNLGSRASGTFSFDFYSTPMEELVGKGRIHHRRILSGAAGAFHCWHCRSEASAIGQPHQFSCRRCCVGGESVDLVNACRHSTGSVDGGLYSLSLCTGEGARHVAKPIVTAASFAAGPVAWFCFVTSICSVVRTGSGEPSAIDTRDYFVNSLADDLGRGFTLSSDGARSRSGLGDGKWALQA